MHLGIFQCFSFAFFHVHSFIPRNQLSCSLPQGKLIPSRKRSLNFLLLTFSSRPFHWTVSHFTLQACSWIRGEEFFLVPKNRETFWDDKICWDGKQTLTWSSHNFCFSKGRLWSAFHSFYFLAFIMNEMFGLKSLEHKKKCAIQCTSCPWQLENTILFREITKTLVFSVICFHHTILSRRGNGN